jgi:hypothetical protein
LRRNKKWYTVDTTVLVATFLVTNIEKEAAGIVEKAATNLIEKRI